MAEFIRVDMNDVWAADGDSVPPTKAKIAEGWLVEAVPRQWWNWMQNRVDSNVAYLLQKGLPEWDSDTEYFANKSYQQYRGIVYKALTDSKGVSPLDVGQTAWAKAFVDNNAYFDKIKNLTPTPGTIAFIDRTGEANAVYYGDTGLGLLQQTSVVNARNFIAAQVGHPNLTALSGVAAGTNVLPYFNGGSTMAATTLTSAGRNLISQPDMPSVRAVLGLGTAATYNAQTDYWSTSGLLIPGAFGLGGFSIISGAGSFNNVNDPNCPSGFYDVSPGSIPGFIAPIAGTWTRIIHQAHANSAGFATQIATGNFANAGIARIFVRKAAGTGWGDWVELMNSSVFQTQSSPTDGAGASPGAGKLLRVGAFGVGARLDLRDTVWSVGTPAGVQGTGTTKGFASGGQLGVPGYAIGDLGVLTVDAQWTDNSGIRGYMRTFSDGANMYIQPSGGTIDSGWAPWRQVYTTGNTADLTNTITANVTANIQPTLNAKQNSLGFNPVQQGTGTGQIPNTVMIGWSPQARLRLQIDSTDFGYQWPIDCVNASTATKLATPRIMSFYGGATGSLSYDGTGNSSAALTIVPDSHTHSISTVSGLQEALNVRTPNSQLAYFTAAQSTLESPKPSGQVVFSVTSEQATAGYSPGCSFVRPGYFGVNLGLSNIDNHLRIGGYSMGAVSYPILHTGNAAALGFGGTSGALGASGWTRLGNGLIIQWGAFTGNGNIPFPTAFPNACVSIAQMQSGELSGNVTRISLNGNPGAGSFNVTGVNPGFNLPARWIALGY